MDRSGKRNSGRRWPSGFQAISLACTLAAGCGGGSDTGVAGPAPEIAITLSSSVATVTPGESISFGVTVTGSNGFTGPATIAVTGAPAGVTASAAAPQFSGSTTTSTVNIAVGPAVSAGTHMLTVTGSGSGVQSVTRSFALTVGALPGGFTIAASAPTITLPRGSSTTATITITRSGGFAGNVGLSATGMSNGLTATFAPASASGSGATLTLTANSVAAIGTVTVTIIGSAGTLGNETTTMQVTVMPRPDGGAGSVAVDFSGCAAGAKPVWFAFQDGNGAWTRVTSTDDIYRFTISSHAGGYAFTTRGDATTSAVTVNLLTWNELTAAPISICPVPNGNKTVMATVLGVNDQQTATVSLGGSSVIVPSSSTVSVSNVPNGTFDLVAWRLNKARGSNHATDSKGVIVRDVNVADGASAGVVSFDAEPWQPTLWPGDLGGGVSGETYSGSMSYFTGPRERCVGALLYNFTNSTPTIPVGAWGFPESVQRPTDFYVLRAVATAGPSTRIAQRSFHLMGGRVDFGASVAPPLVSELPGAPSKRLQVIGATPAEYSSAVSFSYATLSGEKSGAIHATVAWLGGNAATLAYPDFTGVSGWDSSWLPAASSPVLWTFGGTAVTFVGAPCVEGASLKAAYISGEK